MKSKLYKLIFALAFSVAFCCCDETVAQLPAPNQIVVNTGGTLFLSGIEVIPNNTNIKLNGGEIDIIGGGTETVGKLTLSKDSAINIDTLMNFSLYFKNSSMEKWKGNLIITGWTGDAYGGYTTKIFVGNNANGLNQNQLNSISFAGFGNGAILLGSGELCPIAVPELNPWTGAVAIFLLIVAIECRMKKR